MLSFSASAKAEICKENPQSGCCALAQCFGILLFANSFTETQIKIITESQDFARLLPKLFRKAFSVTFDTLPEEGAVGKLVFVIRSPEKIAEIMSAFGFDTGSTLSLHINLPIVEEDCCKAAFLRGAFLAGGSVTSPAKAYHMELATTHQIVSRECDALIRETLGFSPKTASRAGAQVLYLKQSDLISDFLTYLGAPVAAMGIMEARLEKELNNLKLSNDDELARINSNVNLDEIKRIAIGELGMVYAQEGQIVYYNNEGSDYVRQFGDIPKQ